MFRRGVELDAQVFPCLPWGKGGGALDEDGLDEDGLTPEEAQMLADEEDPLAGQGEGEDEVDESDPLAGQ